MAIQRVEIHRSRMASNLTEMETCLRVADSDFQERITGLRLAIEKNLKHLEDRHRWRMNTLQRQTSLLEKKSNELLDAIDKIVTMEKREDAKRIKELEQKIEQMEKNGIGSALPSSDEKPGVEKAKTISIFDSILFAISNWSNDGQIAPDIELACQAVLFPTIYERVMGGESDYVIESVPAAADEVVKRGRELTKYLRTVVDSSLSTPDTWKENHQLVREWIIGDALPLLYGARDPKWDEDESLTLEEILEWKEQPASRALHFPLIFDGMELLERYREDIRETTGLPEFNKRTLTTRLDP